MDNLEQKEVVEKTTTKKASTAKKTTEETKAKKATTKKSTTAKKATTTKKATKDTDETTDVEETKAKKTTTKKATTTKKTATTKKATTTKKSTKASDETSDEETKAKKTTTKKATTKKTTTKKSTAKKASNKNLVIVESPAKAKTIKKYLGRNFEVIASMGHVRDLPKSKLGVDLENNFEPQYINIRKQSETIKKLKAAAKDKKKIYLATDPDREGEAISWHLAHLLKVDLEEENRVFFNEITKTGVQNGMATPRKVDIDLVNSQQARRILDRIVGYKLSPFLWKKVKSGLSAGRVQSVSVRLIVDREEEIKAFNPEEYWSIEAILTTDSDPKPFKAKFLGKDKTKIELKNKAEADAILDAIDGHDFTVLNIKKGTRKKNPSPPFTTSTMQQEASTKLGFQSRRTMQAAQQLYEGLDIDGHGTVGLITYMRTDSLRISDEARDEAYKYVEDHFGKDYIPATPRVYKTKNNAQDAHEAIRPSIPSLTPADAKASLTSDQYKLYKLIWERFTASQMATALVNTVTAHIGVNGHDFTSSGSTIAFKGYMAVYIDSDEDSKQKEEAGNILPVLEVDDVLNKKDIEGNQHFTQPPPRFTEASLIKILEEKGIGRPSTYAATITTILSRNYVEREAKQLRPTLLGEITTNLMKEHFDRIVDADFTANMEKDLDLIADVENDLQWVSVLENFYGVFESSLELAEKNTEGIDFKIPDEESDELCDLCGKNMVIKSGRFGKFLACPGYPDCKCTKKIVNATKGKCPLCDAKILEKKSKKGKKFFGCEKNPTCEFLSWDEPNGKDCPNCGKSLLQKAGKSPKIYCSSELCDYEMAVAKNDDKDDE